MIKQLLMNLLLTLVWTALTGMFGIAYFIFGFILSYFILYIIARRTDDTRYFTRVPRLIGFLFFFLNELIKANMEVTRHVLSPKMDIKPGIVQLPLDAKTDLEITLLANLIGLTPGTLALDVSDDKKVMYVHAMYLSDRKVFIQKLKAGFEKKLLAILR